ncbi:MAG: transposase [Lewinellaceae bacterium]|nr:transposase [Lewinellaceae bacterium]
MGGYSIKHQQALHFVTLTVVGWIDLFTKKEYKEIILENLAFCQQNKGLTVHAFVIMSNHIHLIIQVENPHSLSNVLRDFKNYSTICLLKSIMSTLESRREWLLYMFEFFGRKTGVKHQIWQYGNAPIQLASPDFILQKLTYIHNNPVRAGWVENPTDYTYSSASNYVSGNGVFEVTLLQIMDGTGWIKNI